MTCIPAFWHSRRLDRMLALAGQTATMLLLMVLGACASRDAVSQPAGASVYRSIGSVQCSDGGTPRQTMERELVGAGIQILGSACGADGNMRPALCGAPDGRIAIFEIPAAQTATASSLGFALLSNLPSASKVECRGP